MAHAKIFCSVESLLLSLYMLYLRKQSNCPSTILLITSCLNLSYDLSTCQPFRLAFLSQRPLYTIGARSSVLCYSTQHGNEIVTRILCIRTRAMLVNVGCFFIHVHHVGRYIANVGSRLCFQVEDRECDIAAIKNDEYVRKMNGLVIQYGLLSSLDGGDVLQ